MKNFIGRKNNGVYWSVISLVALSCGGTVLGQTNIVAAADNSTNATANVTDLGNVTVVGKLTQARDRISTDIGASAYTISQDQIATISQGNDAPLDQIILRAPGVAEDNAASGGLHVRGEHANLQYRINDVLLPEGITGFGLELDPRFIDSMQLVTGSLPAEYGFRTAGVVDIKTKSGTFVNGGSAEIYGGSYDTIRPSFEFGGAEGKFNYFVDGSYEHNALGIENPTDSHSAIHDNTDQFKGFTYLSYLFDETSLLSFMGSASDSNFEVPNTPGLAPGSPDSTTLNPTPQPWFTGGGIPTSFNSADLNEQQREQNYFGVVSYQKQAGNFNSQLSLFGRGSGVHFRPDDTGDLFFNGVASDEARTLYSGGLQEDASYDWGKHTIRGGGMVMDEVVFGNANTMVYDMDPLGNPTPGSLRTISQKSRQHALFAGIYLQDEWHMFEKLTLNYGVRFDEYSSSDDDENQLSPRINLVYTPTDSTTLHAGYSRYFTPPPLESISSSDVAAFDGTSNESPGGPGAANDPVKAERADYFDVGLTQKITSHLQVGVDSYYKQAHNQLDDGLFGASLIPSAFNYAKGRVYGVEFTANYTQGGFSTYANIAYSVAQGQGWNSAQFQFDPADLAYSQNNWIYLDHDQRVSGSFGAAYTWKEGDKARTTVFVDSLYGSGLRTDGTAADGSTIPNGGTVPTYYTVNLGAEQAFKFSRSQVLKARLDIVNVTDNSYELRDGGGVGVNAASYGERIGFFGSLSYSF
ncbi:MAG TPA: TonB-dependent receptor [Verrucomicrobiae bacterium]|jgi:outer membrane receptor protein involved in Fe transport